MNKYYRKYITKICIQCGEPYEVRDDHKTSKYCSRQCAGLGRAKKPIKCSQCGIEFIPAKKSTKFCSYKCSGEARDGKITLKCDYCGKEYIKNKCHITKNNFCSKKCHGKWASINNVGEHSPRWNGGIYNHIGKYIHIRQPDGTYKQEHRIVMENHLGRELDSDEIVHHIDGDGENNALDNLRLTTRAEHARLHTKERWENDKAKDEYANYAMDMHTKRMRGGGR